MKEAKNLKKNKSDYKTLLCVVAASIAVVCIGVFIFLHYYSSYIDGVLYKERLHQMREVTDQLFKGIDKVVQNQWDNTDTFCNYLELGKPEDAETLLTFMRKQVKLNGMEEKQEKLVAVDSLGRYLTQDGWQGTLEEMNLLMDKPERVSFVSKSMTSNNTYMFFLKRLSEPVVMQDDGRHTELIYYGVAQDMEQLNPYFTCDAYDNNNSVYVLNKNGERYFLSNNDGKLHGYNVYKTLAQMEYLHDNSFEEAKRELDTTGYGYSNAILDGEEYYYALYQMDNAAWTLLFLVSSAHVATDVVAMVDTTVRLILIFAIVLIVISSLMIYLILRISQKQKLEAERSNNEKLAVINRKLDHKNAELTSAVKLAEEATKAKTEFLSNMSHDIRTPMNAIVGITTLMEHERENPEKLEAYIKKVQSSSKHLLSLINDVLDMSKIESSDVTLNMEPINLSDQISQIDSIVRAQVEERKQNLTVQVHDVTHGFLIGDGVRLRQVFINLLSNAVKYTANGGDIALDITELKTEKPGYAKFLITVSDNGCGMSPEFVDKIFEPFTRAENSTTNKIQGTGLGMAITKNIVDLMGGTISVYSEPGKGSRFDVTVMLAIDENAEAEQLAEAGSRISQGASTEESSVDSILKGMKFLCAEDNELNAEILQAILELEGASCTIYEDGRKLTDAFADVKPGDYDAILMDVQMPVMNGLDAARTIRQSDNPLGRAIPIIAMTANAFSSDVRSCLEAGMDAHVSKPLDIDVLKRTLMSILASKNGGGYRPSATRTII